MKNFLLTFLLAVSSTWLVGQTVTPSASVYQFGDDIVISFSGSTAPLDWVGIYNEGDLPDPNNGGVGSITWFYTNETQDAASATSVIENGTLTFDYDLPNGNYVVHMLCCDGYTVMASSSFTVEGGNPTPSEVYPKNFPFVGGTVTFTFAGGPGNDKDWIGIYKPTDVPGTDPSIMFQYIPSPPAAEGELTFDLDVPAITAGDYKAIFFCCDEYTQLARADFTVYEPTAPSLTAAGILMEDAPNRFAYAGGSGSLSDWVGVYNHGDNPDPDNGGVESLFWDWVSAPNGIIKLTQNDPDDLVAGNRYDAHLFCCGGYDIIASYLDWTVEVFNSTTEPAEKPAYFNASTPNQGVVRLAFNQPIQGEVCLFNTIGQNIQSRKVEGQTTMDFNQLQPGFYSVLFQGKAGRQTAKVVVK